MLIISDPSYPLVKFWQKTTEQADSTFFSVERDTASTGARMAPLGPAAPPSAGRRGVTSGGLQADGNTMTPALVLSLCPWTSLWNLDVVFRFLGSVSPCVSFIKVPKAKVS